MKKILFMVMSVVLMAFVGCKPDEPLPDADKDVTIVDDNIDPNKSTNVTIYTNDGRIYLDNISIYNERDIKVGTGAYVGDYLVPYNGSIVITYHAEEYGYVSARKTDRYQVGTSKQLYIRMYCSWVFGESQPEGLYSEVTNGILKE